MNIKHLLVYLSLGLTVLGVILRSYNYTLGNISLLTGLLYLCLYYLIKTIKEIRRGSDNKLITFFQLAIVLMSVVIYTKYTYTVFGYYLGLVTIPVFMVYAIIYWIKTTRNTIDLTIVSIIYFLLCMPMFAIFYERYPTGQFYTYFYPQQYLKHIYLNLDNTVDTRYIWMPSTDGLGEEAYQLGLQAIMLYDEGKYDEAIENYRQVISLEPYNPSIYYNLSNCYYEIKQYDLALSALDSAIILNPKNTEYYNFRGLMYNDLDKGELALKNFEKSLELDSTNARAYLNLASVYYYLYGDIQKAYEAMEKVALYDPELADRYSEIMAEWKSKLMQE